MNDPNLIAGFLSGNAEIVAAVRQWVRGAATPYRKNLGAELEDLEQEILLELTAALREHRFRGQSQLQTYVRTFVHHKCIDRLRAGRRREWIDVEDLELTSAAPSAFDRLSRSQTEALALKVQAATPEPCRELWRMLLEGLSYREMSARLGVAEGTLRARVLRCRRRALEIRDALLAADAPRKGPK